MTEMTWSDLHTLCEAHLESCLEAMDGGIPDPSYAKFCGCSTCLVREVLCVVNEYFPIPVTER